MNTTQERSFGHDALDKRVDAKSSSTKKLKKKHKRGADVLEKIEKDQGLLQEVGSGSSNDTSKMMDCESNHVKIDLNPPEKRQGKKNRERDALGKSVRDHHEAVTVQPKRDPCPPSLDNFIQKMDTVNAESSSSSKKKGKRTKQKPENDVLGVQSDLKVARLGSRRDSSLMPEKQRGSPQNQNALEVQDVKSYRDLCQPSSNDSIQKMDTKRDQVNEEIISLKESKIKRKKKKQKLADNVLDKSDKALDTVAQVVTVQPKTNLYPASKLIIGNCSQEAAGIQSIAQVAVLGSGEQIAPPKSENILEVKDVQPSEDDFTKKMDTEGEQVIAELSSSNKSTIKRKKKKRGTVSLDKSDKDQDLLEDVVLNSGQEAVAVQPISEVAEVGPRRDNLLMLAKQRDTSKNENAPEVVAVLPNKDLSSPSHDFIKKKETGSELANAVTSSPGKKKRKRKKQNKENDILDKVEEEVVVVQPKSDQCLMFSTNRYLELEGTVKNYDQEAVNVQSVSSDVIKKVETSSELENVTSSSSKQKRKRKTQKRGNDILDKSDNDQKEEVVFVQPKSDQCLVLSTNQCLELEDTVKNYDQKAVNMQSVSELGPRRDNSLMTGKQMCYLNNENISEVEAELPKRCPCPLSSNDFNKKMDIESNQVSEESSSSNKRKKKKKKQKRGNDIINKSDKDQNHMEQVMIVHPKIDPLLNSPADKCVEQQDTIRNQFQVDISGKSASVVVELGTRVDGSLMLGKKIGSLRNENTSEVKVVQPNRDQCPSSNDFNMKVDAESDHGTAELSLSKKKRKKRKKQDDVLDKSDKDQMEEVMISQPKSNLLLQSQANKCLEMEDTVKNCVQEAVNVQSVSQVSKLVSRVDNSLMLGKEVGSMKSENTSAVEAVQTIRDLHPPSSTDFNKNMDTESDQVNAESSTSNKKKRNRKKQKTGDNVLEKSEKDHDLADVVAKIDPCIHSPADKGLKLESVQPNRDPPSNGFIKKSDLDSDQVNVDSSLQNKRKTKKKKQKTVNNVPIKSEKDQDVPEEVQGPVLDVPPRTKKLIILDINGLLCDIVQYGGNLAHKPDTTISRKAVFKRPFCDDFLQFCFERFDVAVWSSRTKDNLDTAVKFLMGDYRHKLVFCWNQFHCTHTKFRTLENKQKPLVLKELKKVWEKIDPKISWKKGDYHESNTLLIDDSPYKALRNPAYTAIFPHPYRHTDASDASLGPGGDLRVYLEGLCKADNTQKYVEENPFGQKTIKDTDPHWHFYSKILQSN